MGNVLPKEVRVPPMGLQQNVSEDSSHQFELEVVNTQACAKKDQQLLSSKKIGLDVQVNQELNKIDN